MNLTSEICGLRQASQGSGVRRFAELADLSSAKKLFRPRLRVPRLVSPPQPIKLCSRGLSDVYRRKEDAPSDAGFSQCPSLRLLARTHRYLRGAFSFLTTVGCLLLFVGTSRRVLLYSAATRVLFLLCPSSQVVCFACQLRAGDIGRHETAASSQR